MSVTFLQRKNAPSLAYICQEPASPSVGVHVVFLTGLASDMMGTKAQFVAQFCARERVPCTRFDFRGHGQSGGVFTDGTIGLWQQDALDIIAHTTGNMPVLLVGSSMGGWVSLLCARDLGAKVAGLIGLAAAPDFTRDILREMSMPQREALEHAGLFYLPAGDDMGFSITRALLEDGEQHCLLDASIPVYCPVRLIQGRKDPDVSWQTADKIHQRLSTDDKKVLFRPEGDHRLSTPEDLAVLECTLLSLLAKA